ncbi:MAG: hypothetical protein H6749_04425 [Nitrospiraceae bacterium]|nr:hypothetical protein [Nitrospiraceae bacterium]
MNSFWIKNKYRIVGAVGLATLYLIIVGAWWVLSGGRGERFGFFVSVLNLPAVLLYMGTPLERWLGDSLGFHIIIFVAGPVQYGLLGWFIGPTLERFDIEGKNSSGL